MPRDRNETDILEELDAALEGGGVHEALRLLNARVPYRFTGVYRLDGPTLRSVHLYDRENRTLRLGADTPVRETYCRITSSSAAPFATADAGADDRLTEHPARRSTLSYCGVPLLDDDGQVIGTLCHFDLVPQPIPETESELLRSAADRIRRALRSPPDQTPSPDPDP